MASGDGRQRYKFGSSRPSSRECAILYVFLSGEHKQDRAVRQCFLFSAGWHRQAHIKELPQDHRSPSKAFFFRGDQSPPINTRFCLPSASSHT